MLIIRPLKKLMGLRRRSYAVTYKSKFDQALVRYIYKTEVGEKSLPEAAGKANRSVLSGSKATQAME